MIFFSLSSLEDSPGEVRRIRRFKTLSAPRSTSTNSQFYNLKSSFLCLCPLSSILKPSTEKHLSFIIFNPRITLVSFYEECLLLTLREGERTVGCVRGS